MEWLRQQTARVRDISAHEDEEELNEEDDDVDDSSGSAEEDDVEGRAAGRDSEDTDEVEYSDDESDDDVEVGDGRAQAGLSREDEQFCEMPRALGDDRRVLYAPDRAPDRAPPIFDFITLLTAFVVAVVAAYYSMASSM
jgi:hypothetical protein